MTEPIEPRTPNQTEPPAAPPRSSNVGAPGWGYPAMSDARLLELYFDANWDRFTEESLRAQALQAGYSADVVESAIARPRGGAVAAPVQATARRILVIAYLGTWAWLTFSMALNSSSAAGIGAAVLSFTLIVAGLLSRWWVRSSGRRITVAGSGLVMLLSLPFVLLVLVAGACYATGLPSHPLF